MQARGDYHQFLKAIQTVQALPHATLLVSELMGCAGFGTTPPIACDNAYVLQLRLLDCHQCSYFLGGQPLQVEDRRAGVLQFHDLRLAPSARIIDPFHVMHLYMPRAALASNLQFEHGACYRDDTIANLLLALRPMLARPQEASALLVEHIAQSLRVQIVNRFGNQAAPRKIHRGGLAAWQVQRARDLIESDLHTDISLSRLASECELSVRHFSRAFAQTFGMPAHRYLTRRRVELALELLKVRTLSIPEIALKCGFVDQSHLTRVFAHHIGSSPGYWRRSQHGA